jgi:Putative MetA-pathway of phenol degradation
MKVPALILAALLALGATTSLVAQTTVVTPTCSNSITTLELICTVPQLFGPGGLTLPNPNHKAHFSQASINEFSPLNVSIGEELSSLPLGSSGSATTFAPDSQGHLVPTEDSLGPILTERANVIGRRAVNLGVAYQYFSFTKIDGVNLHSFPAVLIHITDPGEVIGPTSFKNDYISTTTQAYLALNQTTIYGVYGISSRMDASIEVPIQQVHFRVFSNAAIVRTQPCEYQRGPEGGGNCYPPDNDEPPPNQKGVCGEFHYFDGTNCSTIFNSTTALYPGSKKTDATGIGDVIIRGKYEVLRGEKFTGSLGIGFRFPSGDAKNFLGSGAYGIAPFGIFTYRARLSPHARLGYQWNSHSVLAGDPTGTIGPPDASLPPEFLYSGGADFRATKRITVAADLIGGVVLSASHLSLGLTTNPLYIGDSGTQAKLRTINSSIATYNSDAIALGAKVRLIRELILTGNATIRVNDGGLRANVVPLVGLSYAF